MAAAKIGKFSRPGATGAAGAGGAKMPPKKRSRYGGIKEKDRDPMPEEGDYRFRLVSAVEAQNPGTMKESVKVFVKPVQVVGDEYQEGAQMLLLFMRTTAGLGELKRCIRVSAGFDDVEAYDTFDPDGEFIDAVAGGQQNDYAAFTFFGRLVDCRVTRGKDTGDGDWYRNYQFAVVLEDEQDQVPSIPAQIEGGE